MYEIISNYIDEEFGLLGAIIFVFFIILFIPILIAIVSKFFEIQFFTNWSLNQKNKPWIKIFRHDEFISRCLNEYRQLRKSSEGLFTFLLVYLGLSIGFFAPLLILVLIFIILHFLNIIHSDYIFIYALSLSNLFFSLIPLIFATNLSNRIKVINNDQLESEVKKISNLFMLVISFSLSFAAYFLLVSYGIFLDLINRNPSELNFYFISFIYMATFLAMFFSILDLFNSRNRFWHSIQNLINKKWIEKFPNLCISILGGRQIDGKVNDAFNIDHHFE